MQMGYGTMGSHAQDGDLRKFPTAAGTNKIGSAALSRMVAISPLQDKITTDMAMVIHTEKEDMVVGTIVDTQIKTKTQDRDQGKIKMIEHRQRRVGETQH